MADNIARVNGKDAFAAVGDAWHKKGVNLPKEVDAATMIKAAGLDYPVELVPMTVDFKGTPMLVPNKFAIRRGDTGTIFNVVSNIYEVIPNVSSFSFFDAVIGDGAFYHSAGALGQGEKIWILAKLPRDLDIAGDKIEEYVLLWNGHGDGNAFNFQTTPVRVVCQNTLNVAISGADTHKVYRKYHLKGVNDRLNADDAREILGLAETYYEHFEAVANKLAKTKMSAKKLNDFIELLLPAPKPVLALPAPDPANYQLPTITANRRAQVKDMIVAGRGNDRAGVKGTAWGAFNGVVEYADFVRGRDDNRTASLLMGTGRELKQKAWDILTADIN